MTFDTFGTPNLGEFDSQDYVRKLPSYIPYIYINESPDTLLHSIHYMPYITCQHSITPHCRCIGSGLLPLQDLRRVLHSHGKAFLETSHKFCKKRVYIYIYMERPPPRPPTHKKKNKIAKMRQKMPKVAIICIYIYMYTHVVTYCWSVSKFNNPVKNPNSAGEMHGFPTILDMRSP